MRAPSQRRPRHARPRPGWAVCGDKVAAARTSGLGSRGNDMIEKREVLAISQQTSLTPHIVEKDYVLGWMLAVIYGHEDLAETWVFKGGTCLKKCFSETYRFYDDIDFKVIKSQHLD